MLHLPICLLPVTVKLPKRAVYVIVLHFLTLQCLHNPLHWLQHPSKNSLIKSANDFLLLKPTVISLFFFFIVFDFSVVFHQVLTLFFLKHCLLLSCCHLSRCHGVSSSTVFFIYMFFLMNFTQNHGFKSHFYASESQTCISVCISPDSYI